MSEHSLLASLPKELIDLILERLSISALLSLKGTVGITLTEFDIWKILNKYYPRARSLYDLFRERHPEISFDVFKLLLQLEQIYPDDSPLLSVLPSSDLGNKGIFKSLYDKNPVRKRYNSAKLYQSHFEKVSKGTNQPSTSPLPSPSQVFLASIINEHDMIMYLLSMDSNLNISSSPTSSQNFISDIALIAFSNSKSGNIAMLDFWWELFHDYLTFDDLYWMMMLAAKYRHPYFIRAILDKITLALTSKERDTLRMRLASSLIHLKSNMPEALDLFLSYPTKLFSDDAHKIGHSSFVKMVLNAIYKYDETIFEVAKPFIRYDWFSDDDIKAYVNTIMHHGDWNHIYPLLIMRDDPQLSLLKYIFSLAVATDNTDIQDSIINYYHSLSPVEGNESLDPWFKELIENRKQEQMTRRSLYGVPRSVESTIENKIIAKLSDKPQ